MPTISGLRKAAGAARALAGRLIGVLALAALVVPAAAQKDDRRFPETYRTPGQLPSSYLATLTPEEHACWEAVQGKVAWNKAGASQWGERNLDILCEDTPNHVPLISCFQQQVAQHNDWQLAIEACKNAQRQGRAFPETYRTPDSPQSSGGTLLTGVLPEFNELETTCINTVSGDAAWNQDSTVRQSNLRELCRGTRNPNYTVECFRHEVGRGQPLNMAIGWCKEENRVALGRAAPPTYTPPQPQGDVAQKQCTDLVRCGLSAVLANIPIPFPTGVPGCNGAAICAAIMEQDASHLDAIVNVQGRCANTTGLYGTKELLLDMLGCGIEAGLQEAALAGAPKVNWSQFCAFSPDTIATNLVATLACAGPPRPRQVGGAAACAPGTAAAGPDLIARFQRLLFVPGKPGCLGCPAGFSPPGNSWVQLADSFSGETTCYANCPAGWEEHPTRPSQCRKLNCPFPIGASCGIGYYYDKMERATASGVVTEQNQCPTGWEAGSKLLTEDNFCMSKCDGVAAGEWCFGVNVNPQQARAMLDGMAAR